MKILFDWDICNAASFLAIMYFFRRIFVLKKCLEILKEEIYWFDQHRELMHSRWKPQIQKLLLTTSSEKVYKDFLEPRLLARNAVVKRLIQEFTFKFWLPLDEIERRVGPVQDYYLKD